MLEVETGLFISDYEASHAVGQGSVPLVVGGAYVLGLIRGPDGGLEVANPGAILPREGATVDRPRPWDSDEPPSTITADAFVAEVAATTPLVPDSVVDPEARLRRWFGWHDDPASPEEGDPGP